MINKLKKHKFKLIKSILTVGGIVLIWRGIWGLMDTYFFPNNPEFSYTISIIAGIVILLVDDFSLDELTQ